MNGDSECDQKAVKEKGLEKAFIRAMNWVVGNKEAFLDKLSKICTVGLRR